MSRTKILNTIELSNEIENMINTSYDYLIFVSPYLKITDRLKAKLSNKFSQLQNCFFIHRNNELMKNEKDWITSFSNVHQIGVENLHSKIYLNNNQCIITSMNFYEYSQINNYEIGVIIDRMRERNDYQKVIEEVLVMTKMTEKHDIILKALEPEIDYSVGNLFRIINEITRGKYKNFHSFDDGYVRFCNDARSISDFQPNELYQDKSAILRNVNIGKARFEEILNRLK